MFQQKDINLKIADNEFLDKENITMFSDIPLSLPSNFYFDNSRILDEIDFKFDTLDSSIFKTISYYENLNYPICNTGITINKEN